MNNITEYKVENCKVIVDCKEYSGEVIVNSIEDNGKEILLTCEKIYKTSVNIFYKPINLNNVVKVTSKGTITKKYTWINSNPIIRLNDLVDLTENP